MFYYNNVSCDDDDDATCDVGMSWILIMDFAPNDTRHLQRKFDADEVTATIEFVIENNWTSIVENTYRKVHSNFFTFLKASILQTVSSMLENTYVRAGVKMRKTHCYWKKSFVFCEGNYAETHAPLSKVNVAPASRSVWVEILRLTTRLRERKYAVVRNPAHVGTSSKSHWHNFFVKHHFYEQRHGNMREEC